MLFARQVKVACCSDTEEDSEGNRLGPGLEKDHADHGDAPEYGDGGQEYTRTDLPKYDGGGWLAEGAVGEEESEDDDGIAGADQDEVVARSSNHSDAGVGTVDCQRGSMSCRYCRQAYRSMMDER